MRARLAPATLLALLVALCASACTPTAETLENRGLAMDKDTDAAQAAGDEAVDPADEYVSRAVVVVYGEGEILFVDQDTESPYYPTQLSSALIVDADGNQIAPEDLASGNVVRVTGNGIMLESYPGQYPGISKVEVISEGTPADAEKYSQIVSQIWSPRDPAQVPYASASYETELGGVGLALLECGSIWSFERDGKTQTVTTDTTHPAQYEAESLPDVLVAGPCEVTVSFDVPATDVRVTRYEEEEIARAAGALEGLTETDVEAEVTDGEARLTVEPGGRYVVDATFEAGTVAYVFTVPSV